MSLRCLKLKIFVQTFLGRQSNLLYIAKVFQTTQFILYFFNIADGCVDDAGNLKMKLKSNWIELYSVVLFYTEKTI